MIAVSVPGPERQRKAPPLVFTTVPVAPVGSGVAVDGGVGEGPELTVRYAADAHPSSPAQRIGVHPFTVDPRTGTRVPGASDAMMADVVLAAARQRRLAPPVLLTVASPLPGTVVGVGVTGGAVGVGEGVTTESASHSADIQPFRALHVTGTQPLNTWPRTGTRLPDANVVITIAEIEG